MPDNDDVYLVWSNEHRAWWGPDRGGYVKGVSLAGRYTREHALLICASAIPGSKDCVFNEIPIREADVRAFVEKGFASLGIDTRGVL